jgi:hypothetical protein
MQSALKHHARPPDHQDDKPRCGRSGLRPPIKPYFCLSVGRIGV